MFSFFRKNRGSKEPSSSHQDGKQTAAKTTGGDKKTLVRDNSNVTPTTSKRAGAKSIAMTGTEPSLPTPVQQPSASVCGISSSSLVAIVAGQAEEVIHVPLPVTLDDIIHQEEQPTAADQFFEALETVQQQPQTSTAPAGDEVQSNVIHQENESETSVMDINSAPIGIGIIPSAESSSMMATIAEKEMSRPKEC